MNSQRASSAGLYFLNPQIVKGQRPPERPAARLDSELKPHLSPGVLWGKVHREAIREAWLSFSIVTRPRPSPRRENGSGCGEAGRWRWPFGVRIDFGFQIVWQVGSGWMSSTRGLWRTSSFSSRRCLLAVPHC